MYNLGFERAQRIFGNLFAQPRQSCVSRASLLSNPCRPYSKATGQVDLLKTHFEALAKHQGLKATGQADLLKTLVEFIAKRQVLKAVLADLAAKREVLRDVGQCHVFQHLVKTLGRREIVEASGHGQLHQSMVQPLQKYFSIRTSTFQ